jgi:hypothetical protein
MYGTASYASSASLAYSLYTSNYVAGEAIVASDVMFLGSDTKWYDAAVAGRTIPVGAMIARSAGAYAIGVGVGAYFQGIQAILSTISGTRLPYKDIFIQGTFDAGIFTSTGVITTELVDGFSYMHIGSTLNTKDTVNFDGNNRIYTLAGGRLTALDGYSLSRDIPVDSVEPSAPVAGSLWYKVV